MSKPSCDLKKKASFPQLSGEVAVDISGVDIYTLCDKNLDRVRMGSGYRLIQ